MSNPKRPRGRPRGDGKDDSSCLAQVADLLVRDPSLKPTTAMRKVMRNGKWTEKDETLIRRWQVKFKARRDVLLDQARERARPKPAAVYYAPAPATGRLYSEVVERMLEQQRIFDRIAQQQRAFEQIERQQRIFEQIARYDQIARQQRIFDQLAQQQRIFDQLDQQARLFGRY